MVPQRRVESINRFAERMTRTPAVKQELQKWGMELDPKIRALKGRLLPPEKVFLKTEFTYNSIELSFIAFLVGFIDKE